MQKIIFSLIFLFAISYLPLFGDDDIIVCPIDGTEVVDTADRGPFKGTGRDIRLDMRFITRTYVYPVCPTCSLVFMHGNKRRDALEFYANSVEEVIRSDEYTALPKKYPGQYYLAKIEEFKHGDIGLVGKYYLQASFEAETVRPELVDEMLQLALVCYQQYLPTIDQRSEAYPMTLAMMADMQRRLGMFDEAKETVSLVRVDRHNRDAIAYELVLIERKDREPHLISEFAAE